MPGHDDVLFVTDVATVAKVSLKIEQASTTSA
jgi:hypothetical protein